MTTYCQIGDIARVTFPDGNVQDFNQVPIEISVRREDGTTPQFGTVLYQVNGGSYSVAGTFFAPIFDVYYVVEGRFWGLRVSTADGVSNVGGGSTGGRPFTNLITDWYFNPSNVRQPTKYRIKILDATGTEIFNQLFDTQNYSVECVQGCPPNTLDCGDCCLPCDYVFNAISDIRRSLSRIN